MLSAEKVEACTNVKSRSEVNRKVVEIHVDGRLAPLRRGA
jgi:hypothetical protein